MQFTPENKRKFDELLTRYPVKRSALMPTLALAQEQEGWLHGEAMEYVASLLGLSPAQVHDTASYYTMFAFEPQGKTLIEMCTTLSCTLNGAEGLLQSTCKKLGIAARPDHRGRQVHGEAGASAWPPAAAPPRCR